MRTRRGVIAGGAAILGAGCALERAWKPGEGPGTAAFEAARGRGAGGRGEAQISGAEQQTPAPNSPVSKPPADSAARQRAATQALESIEARLGGRLGVFAIDGATRETLGYRERERFAMCSTFKWLLAAAVLKRSEAGSTPLDRVVKYGDAVILPVSPKTTLRLVGGPDGVFGEMTVEELCEAAVTVSDNAAANLLLMQVGGPQGLTDILRASGDSVTRLDRTEPDLNENLRGDARDTTTPHAMANTLLRMAAGDFLNPASQVKLAGWLASASTGLDRLRGGLPAGWRAGDKTGTGPNGAHNDVAIAWPPGRGPIAIASYMSGGPAANDVKAAGHADIARVIAEIWS